MAEAILRRRGGLDPKSLLPSFTYTGIHSLYDEGKTNKIRHWNITLASSGTFTANRDMLVDLFVMGAGGAGNKDGLGGGGGYHDIANCIKLSKGTSYDVVIGAGGDTNGDEGGQSSAFGYVAEGGEGGTAGTEWYQTCTVRGYPDDGTNVYYYNNYGDTDPTSLGYEPMEADLLFPLEPVEFVVDGQNVYSVYLGYSYSSDGSRSLGYYECRILSYGQKYYTAGETGEGGTATTILNYGTLVGGAGADSGASDASRAGQGGAGNGSYGGSAFGKGGNGIAVLCSTRYNYLDTVRYKSNTRYSTSGGADTSAPGWDITGYIPAVVGDVIRFSNLTWYPSTENEGRGSIYMFDANKGLLTNLNVTTTSSLANWSPVYDSNGYITQITVPDGAGSNMRYIRICCQDLNKTSVVTVNMPIG